MLAPRTPARTNILRTLKPGHPRLLISNEEFDALRARGGTDATLGRYTAWLAARAERILSEPVMAETVSGGGLARVRLERTVVPALLYRLTDDRRFLARAWAEAEAGAREPTWEDSAQHSYVLSTAESATALALCYDWLYDALTPDQRATLRAALIRRALQPALSVYTKPTGHRYWPDRNNNWNQVCNGGAVLAALAVADEESDLASRILGFALDSLPTAMREFAPDGGWEEGPGYWRYGVMWNVYLLAALDSALGTDFGFSEMPGFRETGDFWMHAFGPTNECFNFSDSSAYLRSAPQLFWLARQFDKPHYAWFERDCIARLAEGRAPFILASDLAVQDTPVHWLHLLWFDGRGESPTVTRQPLDAYFRKCEVVTMRSAWEDPAALFVGFKAGTGERSHRQLDAGAFVLDARGVRWALDLGSESYSVPGYFETWEGSSKRHYSYYRIRPEGHNTLVINPDIAPQQEVAAFTRIVRRGQRAEAPFAVADLSPAYARQARSVLRGVALPDDRLYALIQDEIHAEHAVDLWWFLHTRAEIELGADGRSAVLRQEGRRLWAGILGNNPARFIVLDARPLFASPDPPGQDRNAGVRKLTVHWEVAVNPTLPILLAPLADGQHTPPVLPEVRPLAEWY